MKIYTQFFLFLLCLLTVFSPMFSTVSSAAEEMSFSKSDYNDVASEAEDAVIHLEGNRGVLSDTTRGQSGNPVVIERKGVYRITGQSDGVKILIREPKKSGNIYLILDHVSMVNGSGPCIESEAAEKTIIQCIGDNRLVSTSEKGAVLLSDDDLTVNGTGRLLIESGKNGINCKDTLRITGAVLIIQAENDALKGKNGILIDGGQITITKSYEGLEGGQVLVQSGELRVYASDDGINAAGNEDSQGDVIISGGTIFINAAGDAIDSNHSILIEGGTTLVEGPENSRNSIFDKGDAEDAVLRINGGTVLAIGSAEKAKNFQEGSQYSRLERVSGHAGDQISVDDGNEVSLTASKEFSCVIYSSPAFTESNHIQLSAGTLPEEKAVWDTSVPPEIPEEISFLFDLAARKSPGIEYSPIAVLGRQKDTFCILCRVTAAFPGAIPYHALVYFHADPSSPEIQEIREIWIVQNY